MNGIGGDDSISILRLCPLQGDGRAGGGIDAGSRLANRLCAKLMHDLVKYKIILFIQCKW